MFVTIDRNSDAQRSTSAAFRDGTAAALVVAMATEILTCAATILATLGGSKFIAMTGAKNLLGDTRCSGSAARSRI